MHYDLIVIGMGLSGLMAAKTAAEAGKRVLVIGKGIGTLSLFSNTIDVLGKIPETMSMVEGLSGWVCDHPEHPYAKMGRDTIEEALSSFCSLFPSPYSFDSVGDGNCLIPTGVGTFRPTRLVPSTMRAGVSLKKGEALIVGFKGFKDFYAGYAADHFECRSLILSLPEASNHEITSTALARWMESKPFRDRIGHQLRRELKDETRVGFPAVLGVNDPSRTQKGLEEILGVGVFEIPNLPPSIPGMRIFHRFRERLIERGVAFLLGYPVSEAVFSGNRCVGIQIHHPPVTTSYTADRYLLASGRFVGGGLAAGPEKISEPLFRLPVEQPESRRDWFGTSFLASSSHAVHSCGIRVDQAFRPVDGRGKPLFENVWVAGSILSGHHFVEEGSREGISISTGYAAAKNALNLFTPIV
jgi:glycerol-3-phosphate dehydrogenase subunit B